MPANHKVSVAWQIVFTFLPIVNFWAFYRIRKLRKYLMYAYVPALVTSIALLAYYYSHGGLPAWGDDGLVFSQRDSTSIDEPLYRPWHSVETLNEPEIWGPLPPQVFYASILGNVIGFALQGFAIYLVIIWSRQHNRNFDTPA